jgi:hypothetical protein
MATKATTAATGKTAAAQTKAAAKPAAAKVAPPPAAESAPEPAPAAKVGKPQATTKAAAASKPAPSSEPADEAQKKTRQQMTVIIGTDISPARCTTHFRKNLGDAEIEAQIASLRKDLKAALDGKKVEQVKTIKAAITKLQQSLVRVSSETPIAAAAVLDRVVKELLCHGLDQAKASEDKQMEVAHLHDGNPSNLVCFPLINKLPEWEGFDPDLEEELKQARTAENKAAKEAREAKKAAEEKKGAGAAARAKAAAEEDEEEDESQEHTKTTFVTYVDNALKSVKKSEEYRSMRVSIRVREYLSDIVASAIKRMASLSRIIVQQVMSVRTMNAGHVMAVVALLMTDEGHTDEQVAELKTFVDGKLALFRAHQVSERKKKEDSLAADKREEMARKKQQLDLARKKKQLEGANKRMADIEKKAKELAAETARLEPIVAAAKVAGGGAAAEKQNGDGAKP